MDGGRKKVGGEDEGWVGGSPPGPRTTLRSTGPNDCNRGRVNHVTPRLAASGPDGCGQPQPLSGGPHACAAPSVCSKFSIAPVCVLPGRSSEKKSGPWRR